MVKLDERPPTRGVGRSKDLPPMAIDYSRIRMPEPHKSLIRPPDERSLFARLLSNRLRREFAVTFLAGLLALALVALVLAERSNLQRAAFDSRIPADEQVTRDRSTGGFQVDSESDPATRSDSDQDPPLVVSPNGAMPQQALPPIEVDASTTSPPVSETTVKASTTTQSTKPSSSTSTTTPEKTSTTSTTMGSSLSLIHI